MGDLHGALLESGFSDDDIKFPEYASEVFVLNLRIPVLPRAIVEPRTSQLVSASVRVANEFDLKVQARSGGHSYANYSMGGSDGHLIVDLKHFKEFQMDTTTWRANVGPAVSLKDLCQLLHDHGGRAIPHGTCPAVGIGGHATTGGMGELSRKWGFALDAIKEAEVVVATGEVLNVSEKENADLFWVGQFAIRGAASSFAIVTKFIFETHPEPDEFLEYSFVFGLDANIFNKWQKFVSKPQLDFNLSGNFVVLGGMAIVTGTYCGSEDNFNNLKLEEAFEGHAMLSREISKTSWLDCVTGLVDKWKDSPKGMIKFVSGEPCTYYGKSVIIKESDPIKDEAIEDLFKYIVENDPGTKSWFMFTELQNGFSNSITPGSTAYGHRDTLYVLQCAGIAEMSTKEGKDALRTESSIATVVKFLDGLTDIVTSSMPNALFGHYTGYIDPAVDKRHYWGERYNRLVELKLRWDPNNRFANPQSVEVELK